MSYTLATALPYSLSCYIVLDHVLVLPGYISHMYCTYQNIAGIKIPTGPCFLEKSQLLCRIVSLVAGKVLDFNKFS